ncbi:MAG: hypothetical protein ACREDL_11305, partial [Bradyrhizobium sp.]
MAEEVVILRGGVADCLVYVFGGSEEVESDIACPIGETGFWVAGEEIVGAGWGALKGCCVCAHPSALRRSFASARADRSSWLSSARRSGDWSGRSCITIRSATLWRVCWSLCAKTSGFRASSCEFIVNLWGILDRLAIGLGADALGRTMRHLRRRAVGKRFVFVGEILRDFDIRRDYRLAARHGQHAVENAADIVGNRRTQPRDGLIDLRQPRLKLTEDSGKIAAGSCALHHITLESARELL